MAFVSGAVLANKLASSAASCSEFAGAKVAMQPAALRRVATSGVSMMFGPQYYRVPRGRVYTPVPIELSLLAPLLGLGPSVAYRPQRSAPSSVRVMSDVERKMKQEYDMLRTTWQPRYKTEENETEYILLIEAPGVPKEQISLELKDDVLTVTGGMAEMKEREQARAGVTSRSASLERRFRRSFRINQHIDKDQIRAAVKDGIVRVRMPKIEHDVIKTRKIEFGDDSSFPQQ
eukprot:CAMPEP_0185832030 /NCGR_PEP_ID=MMETSP1353-20130828/1847_1 /TAXON_ID=1077150 /ORGANISM="Erythrolobus australicus, Strain CCMP3124" /LENGTH=231 /DNA_ID=CAMNT_0028530163 /DNA_START=941 /DNA_END=1636 /DNA_ORIENTATION=-